MNTRHRALLAAVASGLGLLLATSGEVAASAGPTSDGQPVDVGADVGDATLAPWLSLLVALERDYRPGLEALPQLAIMLADAPEEVLIVWDQQGHFLFYAVGDCHQVRIPRASARRLEGSVAIHNHPRGFPPSSQDLDTVLRYGLRRLYVAARVEGVISLIDIGRDEAVQRVRPGGLPLTQPNWRPVVATPASLVIEGPVVIAAQIAYRLLGVWL